jgi:CubicO group peptidase (beta-lactamase class C family)
MKNFILTFVVFCSFNINAQELQTLEQWHKKINESDFSGVILAAHNKNIIFQKSFGFANRESQIPFGQNTIFDIGSITKQFTAAAIVKLTGENKISLEDTLSVFFDNVPEDKKVITLHHLLTHSAGFPHAFGLYPKVESKKFIAQALNVELSAIPGDKYSYSNVGYSLLALVIEKVTGDNYEKYIRDNLLIPSGLEETGYTSITRNSKRLAISYGRDPNAFQRFFSITATSEPVGHSLQHQYDDPGPRWYMEGAGGFLSTIDDMYKWYLALRSGYILNKESWTKIFTPHIAENKRGTSHYGYGWALDKDKDGNSRVSHDGSNGYTYAVFKYLPEMDVFIFIATNNRDDYPSDLIENFDSIFVDVVANKSFQQDK